MARVKRTRYVLFELTDSLTIDVAALLRGKLSVAAGPPDVCALAILTGRRERLSREEHAAVLSVPAERWIDAEAIGARRARSLAERGVLLSDEDDEQLAALRARDADLTEGQWNLYAATYHFMTQWEGVDVRDDPDATDWTPVSAEAADEFLRVHGPPPPPFHSPAPHAPTLPLPPVDRDGGLYAALAARRTTRGFATGTAMRAGDLATVLRCVFGAQGVADTRLGPCIKRTSPSGGARHPVEAYPLIAAVEDVPSGVYHYDTRRHALTRLESMDAGDVRSLATSFMCGQSYFGGAHVTLVLTARFVRSNWKYRRADKAYAGVLMDAAHLSQTLYLVATELGLGAYVTVALNSRDIERRLRLDGCREGVVAIAGCGPRASGGSPLEPRFAPLGEV